MDYNKFLSTSCTNVPLGGDYSFYCVYVTANVRNPSFCKMTIVLHSVRGEQ